MARLQSARGGRAPGSVLCMRFIAVCATERMADMLLSEHSPRAYTGAYIAHRLRAIAEHRTGELLAQAAFLVFGLAAARLTWAYLPDDFAARIALLLASAAAAGGRCARRHGLLRPGPGLGRLAAREVPATAGCYCQRLPDARASRVR